MRPSASLVPTAACAVGSTTTSIPAARMCPPPIPTKRTPGSTARRARQSVPPWRSPEAPPAESMIGARPAVGSATVIGAHQRDPRPIGELDDRLAVDEQHAPGRHRERGGAALAHRLDGGVADCRHVEAIVVGGGYRLHYHRAGARETAAAGEMAARRIGLPVLGEGARLPELTDEDGGLDPLRGEARDHRLDVGDRGGDDVIGGLREAGGLLEGEGHHAPAVTPGFLGGSAGKRPGPGHQAERTLHGRSSGQAVSPRPSRIIRSISSATASDRRSSASGSSTGPLLSAARTAEIRWRISSFKGLSLCTRRCSTKEAWR